MHAHTYVSCLALSHLPQIVNDHAVAWIADTGRHIVEYPR